VNLRFPGQYYDKESGLHYNYFRYQDPSTGRYLKSWKSWGQTRLEIMGSDSNGTRNQEKSWGQTR